MQCTEKVGPGEVRQGLGEHGGHPGITGASSPKPWGIPVAVLCPCRRQVSGLGLGAGTPWSLVRTQHCRSWLTALVQPLVQLLLRTEVMSP